jgi:hypothetical protein
MIRVLVFRARNQSGGNHGLAECRGSAYDPDAIGQGRINGVTLFRTQDALEGDVDPLSIVTLVFHFKLDGAIR